VNIKRHVLCVAVEEDIIQNIPGNMDLWLPAGLVMV
jgi:hypothetical protein